jgi:adenine-specific DNA methylase
MFNLRQKLRQLCSHHELVPAVKSEGAPAAPSKELLEMVESIPDYQAEDARTYLGVSGVLSSQNGTFIPLMTHVRDLDVTIKSLREQLLKLKIENNTLTTKLKARDEKLRLLTNKMKKFTKATVAKRKNP